MSWAKQHDRCTQCGTTKVRHWGHGLCQVCYRKWDYRQNTERHRLRCKRWNVANYEQAAERSKAWAKANPEKVRENNRRSRAKHYKFKVGETVYIKYAGFWCEGTVTDRPNRNLRTVTLKGGTVIDAAPRLLRYERPEVPR